MYTWRQPLDKRLQSLCHITDHSIHCNMDYLYEYIKWLFFSVEFCFVDIKQEPYMPLRRICWETWTPSSHVLSTTHRSTAEHVLRYMLLNYCARSWYARSSNWPLAGIRSYQGRRTSQRILKRFYKPNNSKLLFSTIFSVTLQKTSQVLREGLSERAHHSTLRMTKRDKLRTDLYNATRRIIFYLALHSQFSWGKFVY